MVSDDELVKECQAILHSASADRQFSLPKAAGRREEMGFAKPKAGRTSAVGQSLAACVCAADVPSAAQTSTAASSELDTARLPEQQLQGDLPPEPGGAGDDFMSNMMADLLA